MHTVTVRRWIDQPLERVFERVLDLDALVVEDPELDLVDLDGDGRLRPGATAIVSHRRGHRQVNLAVQVQLVLRPARLELAVTAGHATWIVHLRLEPCGEHSTDLHLHAELDPAATPRAVLRGLTRPLDRSLDDDVTAFLESLARRAADGPVAAGQRMAPGR